MSLILPDSVVNEIENQRKEEQVDAALGRAKEFFFRLQEIDPNLDLVLAHDNADDPRLLPGFWHIRRLNDGIAQTYMPITTPDGGWAEPSDYHLNLLRERDMWRDGGIDQIYARIRAREREHEQREQATRDERKDTFATHYKSLESPGILFSDMPWSWRAGARRG